VTAAAELTLVRHGQTIWPRLASGHLRAAVLEVFDLEPPTPDDPLAGRPGVLATPHLAGASRQVAEESAEGIAAEVARILPGTRPRLTA
jgi:D-3-phosphoglycerate dehydrogenase